MPDMKALWRAALCAAALGVLSLPAAAAGAADAARLRMIAAVTAHDGAPFLAGVEMRLAAGWKTYWKNPGDSGIAPAFDWSASENVGSVDLRWPAPRRFDDPGDVTFGYKDEVIWPLGVVPVDAAQPATLRLAMSYGVCSDSICVPREANLTLIVPPVGPGAAAAPSADGPPLVAALARLPRPFDDPGALTVRWREAEAPVLEVDLQGCGAGCAPPQLIVDGPDGVWFGRPAIVRAGGILRYSLEVGVLSASVLEGERLG
ncbi:MAG: protein-disulfide reductase DsbD domain-containing protein, partial [Parvibaculum sp.]